jgi:hypothetical protein
MSEQFDFERVSHNASLRASRHPELVEGSRRDRSNLSSSLFRGRQTSRLPRGEGFDKLSLKFIHCMK